MNDMPKKHITCPICEGEKTSKQNDALIVMLCEGCNGSGFREIIDIRAIDENIYFYIDQNVISDKREGTFRIPEDRRFDLSQAGKHNESDFVVYVYSNETLSEIERSGRPIAYLDVLKKLRAQKLVEQIDILNTGLISKPAINTGKLQPIFKYIDPLEVFEHHKHNKRSPCQYLKDFVLYAKMVLHVASFIDMDPVNFEFSNLESGDRIMELSEIVNQIRIRLGTNNSEANLFSKYENPIAEIWQRIIKPKLKYQGITEDIFLDYDESMSLTSDIVSAHIVLNIIGFYPDKNRKIESNVMGFMSDVRHVNMALRTDVFLTYDNNLARRAAVLYKWENLKTGYSLMTVFRKFGRNDRTNYVVAEGETADQASDRWKLFYTDGQLYLTD